MVGAYKGDIMSTRRQRQILRNRKLEFERTMEENMKEAKKIVNKKKTTKKAKKEEE